MYEQEEQALLPRCLRSFPKHTSNTSTSLNARLGLTRGLFRLAMTQVYRGKNRQDIVGVILVKELLEYVKHFPDSAVSSMKIRQLPR